MPGEGPAGRPGDVRRASWRTAAASVRQPLSRVPRLLSSYTAMWGLARGNDHPNESDIHLTDCSKPQVKRLVEAGVSTRPSQTHPARDTQARPANPSEYSDLSCAHTSWRSPNTKVSIDCHRKRSPVTPLCLEANQARACSSTWLSSHILMSHQL